MSQAAFMVVLFLFLYPYLIYPALLYCLAPWFWKRRKRAPEPEAYPEVAMVICALNEERVMAEKLANCLALEYPPDKLRIVVVSDGSTDRTVDVVRRYTDPRIELIEQPVRHGKIWNLNRVVPGRSEEIIVLSDANVMYRADALARLIERFQDPAVGCVSGKVILTGSAPALDAPTESYYSLEWFLQAAASFIHSMVGADGAMYALRRELFRPCPSDTLIEDLVIPMGVIGQGKRVVHELEAVGWERGPASLREEFRRKSRIAAGAAQALVRGNGWPPLSAPAGFWFVFVSHKLLRWLSPVLGLLLLVCAVAASAHPAAQVIIAAMDVVTTLALIRMLSGWKSRLVSLPFYFLFGQMAAGIGLLRGFAGKQSVLWAKENR
jgi:cellulose synthase/poly-beta-1,6-N-acetylglucosamine synthase-like glycosyltransferase